MTGLHQVTENTEEGPIQSESEQEYASCSFEQGNSCLLYTSDAADDIGQV